MLALLAGSALAGTLPAAAWAVQSPAPVATDAAAVATPAASTANADSTSNESGENVIVTAQRRAQKVQAVPIAITALGGSKLLDGNIQTANDVARFVPNLTGANGGGRVARPRYFLRGVGVNDPSGNVVSPTGIYIDDVYYGDTAYQTFPLFDIERVEVLRGPQGTLWGKNTIGGAI
ncbi:MAG: Plug domain-containing protein, partial [Asticcacaulis sp.]|nr:Plug domain-containing protein [Asticcacaulis sp.]